MTPAPPHTRQRYEQTSEQNMTQNASKQGKLDSFGAIFLFIFLPCIRNEKAAQRVSFGAGHPADVHADILADVRGQKLRSGPQNPGKTSIWVRISLSRRRGRPRPEGLKKKLRSEKLWAEFSFPIVCGGWGLKMIPRLPLPTNP